MSRRAALALLALVALATAVAVALASSRTLPGEQRIRSAVGLGPAFGPCERDAGTVRYPRDEEATGERWATATPIPISQDEYRAAAVGGTIYVGSGLREGDADVLLRSTGVFFAFDASRQAFRRLPDLPVRVDHPAVAADDEHLYLVGGWRDGAPTAAAWRYSPATDRWTTMASLPLARAAAGAAVADGRLYVVGGATGEHFGIEHAGTTRVDVYDLGRRRWTRGPDMPTRRHHHGVFALAGMVYAVGGRNDEDLSVDAFERLDPERGTWTGLPPLPLGAGGPGVAVVGGRGVVVGGGDDGEGWVTPAAWSFAPRERQWRRLPDLRVARHGAGVAAAGNRVFVFGGSPCPGWGETASVESLRLP